MNSVVRKLIAKELYVNRWFMTGASVSGVLSVLIAAAGSKTAFNVGALTWMTTIIAFGVMLAIYSVSNERKEHTLLFVLSLPLSTGDYVRSKQLGLTLTFLIPWLLSSVAAVTLILAKHDIPDGLTPFTVLLCVFMLANFSVVLCGALHATSEAWTNTVVVIANMGVSVFMFTVGPLPQIQRNLDGAIPVWNDAVLTVLAIELLVIVLAFVLPRFVAARRRDFI